MGSTLSAPLLTSTDNRPDDHPAGSITDELAELAKGEQLAVLTSMPSLSTLHCVTSRHDTTALPRM